LLCPAGLYNDLSTSLAAGADCLPCPERMYCVDGVKGSDFCESGGICLTGADSPFAVGAFTTGMTTGEYLCPMGSYCVKPGDSKPNVHLACPAGKYTYFAGATKADDCSSCLAGFYC